MSDRRGLILAVAALAAALVVFLASTGPRPSIEAASSVRRFGGVCLELERWSLLGWDVYGQTHTVRHMQDSDWQPTTRDPPCATVEQRSYLVRVFDVPTGTYRLCGLADDGPCVEFRRVLPQGSRGPIVTTVGSTTP